MEEKLLQFLLKFHPEYLRSSDRNMFGEKNVLSLCDKNQQNAHFLHYCFNSIIVSSTCFEQPSVHPQEHEVLWHLFHTRVGTLIVATIYLQLIQN